MREYGKTIKTYETQELKKCVCDRCKTECEVPVQRHTSVEIRPRYAGEGDKLIRDLCPKCTRELAAWFIQDEDVKDFVEILDIWEKRLK